jgi:hypothetical protein
VSSGGSNSGGSWDRSRAAIKSADSQASGGGFFHSLALPVGELFTVRRGSRSRGSQTGTQIQVLRLVTLAKITKGDQRMIRTAFAVAFAGFIVASVPGGAQAAVPLAPIHGIANELGNLNDVAWRRCWRDRWGRRHCSSCWRDRWGRVHCRRLW